MVLYVSSSFLALRYLLANEVGGICVDFLKFLVFNISVFVKMLIDKE